MTWTLSAAADAAAQALRRDYPYEGGGTWNPDFCVARAVPHAIRLAQMLRINPLFHLFDIGTTDGRCHPMHTTRRDPETNQQVPGPDLMSVHGVGRALDVMVVGLDPARPGHLTALSPASYALGSAIANWLVQNCDQLGVQLVIWDHKYFQPSMLPRRLRTYTGPNPHTDHVHVEVKLAPGTALAEPGPEENPSDPDFLHFSNSVTAQPAAVPDASAPLFRPLGPDPPFLAFRSDPGPASPARSAWLQGIADYEQELIAAGVPADEAHRRAVETAPRAPDVMPGPGVPELPSRGGWGALALIVIVGLIVTTKR
jgi:hypothetical protein